jgi:hypothetical protein
MKATHLLRRAKASTTVRELLRAQPHILDWTSSVSRPQPIDQMQLRFNTTTCQGIFTPRWR